MSSREQIMNAVKGAQPELLPLPEVPLFAPYFDDPVARFIEVLSGSATIHFVKSYAEIVSLAKAEFPGDQLFATTIPELSELAVVQAGYSRPHDLENTELAVIEGQFGVAENGAVWITEDGLPERVFPFIPQHLGIVLHKDAIVRTMHDAYEKIGAAQYGWGCFISGPSKTADIEQSLVLGAHGPRTATIFLFES